MVTKPKNDSIKRERHRSVAVTLHSGRILRLQCPANIQRIDHKATHGWQLRYHGTKFYADRIAGGDPRASLANATAELAKRINKHPAPTRLQRGPSANKTSDLPAGTSGPIVRRRPGAKVSEANLSVSLPRFGAVPRRGTIYIGNENTYTLQRFNDALARAIDMRGAAERQYQRDATAAKRKTAAPPR